MDDDGSKENITSTMTLTSSSKMKRRPSTGSVQTAKSNTSLMKKVLEQPHQSSSTDSDSSSSSLVEDFFHLFHLEENESQEGQEGQGGRGERNTAKNEAEVEEESEESDGKGEENFAFAVQLEQAIGRGLLWSALYVFDLWSLALWFTVFCGDFGGSSGSPKSAKKF